MDDGVYVKWNKLGKLLEESVPEWNLWRGMDGDAESLPFHTGEAVYKDPIGKCPRCGPGSATNPCDLIRALLTNGRSAYRVTLPLRDSKYDRVVAHLNPPFPRC